MQVWKSHGVVILGGRKVYKGRSSNSTMEKSTMELMGSRDIGETLAEQIEREANWREAHSCSICGNFECRGDCLDGELEGCN
jgi:hypothetical protein